MYPLDRLGFKLSMASLIHKHACAETHGGVFISTLKIGNNRGLVAVSNMDNYAFLIYWCFVVLRTLPCFSSLFR
ncbi:hypothetical protein AB205_0161500 [Aquarana catesbeiana]|uniref:Uncharacterized protein n=1 Tax=Aquarana catesbeiana TaxID=8400 RepID=A0A2G9RFJ4_AQUCT|nr:hypothetical protein AB205_0161500 [Aquarana catesbeiana]